MLLTKDKWPESVLPQTNEAAESEFVKDPPLSTYTLLANCHNPLKNLEAIIDCSKFGNFQKLIRVMAYVFRFTRLLKRDRVLPPDLSASELNKGGFSLFKTKPFLQK